VYQANRSATLPAEGPATVEQLAKHDVTKPPGYDQTAYDAAFLARLRRRDPATCTWFIFSFTPILEAMLRYRLRDLGAIEDLRNETFCRVFTLVDRDRVRDPAAFRQFVRGVCEMVVREHFHQDSRVQPLSDGFEAPDGRQSIVEGLADQELRALVRNALRKLSDRDRELITEVYLEEKARPDLAQQRELSVVGLNVRLCRALKRLKTQVFEDSSRTREIRKAKTPQQEQRGMQC
jgi:RNA polymerase sigma-70 factor, ECF subfamily